MVAGVLWLLFGGKNERSKQIINEADPCAGCIQLDNSLLYKGRNKVCFFTSYIVPV